MTFFGRVCELTFCHRCRSCLVAGSSRTDLSSLLAEQPYFPRSWRFVLTLQRMFPCRGTIFLCLCELLVPPSDLRIPCLPPPFLPKQNRDDVMAPCLLLTHSPTSASFLSTTTDYWSHMSLPTSGQVYLTGTVHLRHSCRASGNVNVIFSQASIECRPCMTRCEMVQGLFRDYVAEEMLPLPDGLYNVSSKVMCSPPRCPCQFLYYLLRLSHFAPTCLYWALRIIMTLSSYLDRLSTYVEDNLWQTCTYLWSFRRLAHMTPPILISTACRYRELVSSHPPIFICCLSICTSHSLLLLAMPHMISLLNAAWTILIIFWQYKIYINVMQWFTSQVNSKTVIESYLWTTVGRPVHLSAYFER